jgi:E3 ubiquitin-protein ligase RNF13
MEEGNISESLLGPTERLARDIGLRGVLKLWALGSLLGLAVTLAYLTQPAESTVYIATAENATFSFADADAAFGGLISPNGLRGVLRRSDPLKGCGALNIRATAGEVEFALIERGDCTFDEKVRNAQNAGFAAAIIYNDEPGRELITSKYCPHISVR